MSSTPSCGDAEEALNAAFRLLSYRPRSEAELRSRLSRRFAPEGVEAAIAQLKRMGLVDDAQFARFWRESREQHRPRSASIIRLELLRLGVEREVVQEALEGLDEEDSAYRAAARLVRRLRGLDYRAFKKKVGGYLQRRGFSAGVVRETVSRLWRELAETAGGEEDRQQKHQPLQREEEPPEAEPHP
jgi:regulatory protein